MVDLSEQLKIVEEERRQNEKKNSIADSSSPVVYSDDAGYGYGGNRESNVTPEEENGDNIEVTQQADPNPGETGIDDNNVITPGNTPGISNDKTGALVLSS